MLSLAFLFVLLWASVVGAQPYPPTCETFATLDKLAKGAGKKYYGSASDLGSWSDESYLSVLGSEFGQITPANAMKWGPIHPEQDTYNFTGADEIVAFAKAHNQLVRGHNLCWYNQNPDWLTYGNWTKSELLSVLEEHIATVVGRYKGQIYAWDVINEPLLDDGTWRPDIWYNITGTDYIATALRAARAADPDAKLYINDYNAEGINNKSLAHIQLVKNLTAQGVPIDGYGFQSHFTIGGVPSTMETNLRRFIDLGLEVAITELDIRGYLPVSDFNMTAQAVDWQHTVDTCMNVCGCVGVTVWDFDDAVSWVPSTFAGQGWACQWDSSLLKKPSYYSAAKAMAGQAQFRDWPAVALSAPTTGA